MNSVETSLENAGTSRRRTRSYSSRNRLHRDMVKGHPVFELFGTGSRTDVAICFYSCCVFTESFYSIFERDVSMETRGVGELGRHLICLMTLVTCLLELL